MITTTFRSCLLFGALGLPCAACIITLEDDDAGDGSSDGTDPPPPTGLPSDSTGPVPPTTTTGTTGPATTSLDDTGTDEGSGTTTGGPMGECTDNLLGDPGFEAGTPNPAWDEASTLFGTPICDTTCTDEPGVAPYAGDWWVWLGGVTDEVEVGSVAQVVTIDPEMAYLGFWFQVRSAAGTGDDVFTVTLDGDTVFMVTDADMPEYEDYTQVYIDVSAFADGADHELVFTGELAGVGLTSFFVDEVSLVSCVEEGGSSSGSSGSGSSGSGSGGSGSGGSTGAGSSGSSG